MILLIDNYDSFSYNLYQLIGMVNPDIKVVRNDVYTVKQITEMPGFKGDISDLGGPSAGAGETVGSGDLCGGSSKAFRAVSYIRRLLRASGYL